MLPLPQLVETEVTLRAGNASGLYARFGQPVHCIAAEPHATFLRIGVAEDDAEVAYEIVVVGRLRRGYRVLQYATLLCSGSNRMAFGTYTTATLCSSHLSWDLTDHQSYRAFQALPLQFDSLHVALAAD